VAELARELGVAAADVAQQIAALDRTGLMLPGIEEGLPPILRSAGRQYLVRGAQVSRHVLSVLRHVIDERHAREGLLFAGVVVVDEFRYQLLAGEGVAGRLPAGRAARSWLG
jgi:hypothetical protein